MIEEQFEILRRSLERGLRLSEDKNDSRTIDIFHHCLDNLKELRKLYYEDNQKRRGSN